jgi:hypothetical protein
MQAQNNGAGDLMIALKESMNLDVKVENDYDLFDRA